MVESSFRVYRVPSRVQKRFYKSVKRVYRVPLGDPARKSSGFHACSEGQ